MLTTLIVLNNLAALGTPVVLVIGEIRPPLSVVSLIGPGQSAPLLRDFPVEVAILDDRRRNPFGVIEHRFPVPGREKHLRAKERGSRNLRHRSGTRGH